ncbi:hypothetical protein HQ571_00465 [Candidatus Kuenenbacteria bacterium]|nr:hypothetical protein [Candidatus Kuenenbacteria bacterium]
MRSRNFKLKILNQELQEIKRDIVFVRKIAPVDIVKAKKYIAEIRHRLFELEWEERKFERTYT